MKIIACAAVLSVLPVLAFAMGCSHGTEQTQSCAPGTVWDADAQSCVQIINS